MAKLAATMLDLLYIGAAAAAGTTVSIGNDPSLGQQHTCLQHCLYWPGEPEPDVGAINSCDQPYLNVCYCATASAAAASNFVSSCVSASCAAGDLPYDITSAISIYDNYCQTAGYTLPGAGIYAPSIPTATQNSSPLSTDAPTATNNSPTVTVTQTVHSGTSSSTSPPSSSSVTVPTSSAASSTATPSSTSSSGSEDSYTRPSELAQILGSVLGTIFAVITIALMIYIWKKDDRFKGLLLKATRRNNHDRSRGSSQDSSIGL